jgi:ABC-type molybdate transport system permease subunit
LPPGCGAARRYEFGMSMGLLECKRKKAMSPELIQYLVTLILPPVIFGVVLALFLGIRELRKVVWP